MNYVGFFHFLSHTHHHDYQLFSNFHRHEPKSSRSPFSVLRPLPHPSSVEPKPPESYALRSPPPFSTPPSRQVPTDYCLPPRPTPYRILPKASGTAAGDPVDKIDHQRQQLFFFSQSRIFPVVPAHCSANHFPTLQGRLAHAITPSSTKHSYLASLDISLVVTRHRHYHLAARAKTSRITWTCPGDTALPLVELFFTLTLTSCQTDRCSLLPPSQDPHSLHTSH